MTPEERELLDALLSWRQALVEAGVPHAIVPLPEDLETIATTPSLTRDMLPRLSFRRPESVEKYAPGVFSTLRTTRREIEQRAAASPAPSPTGATESPASATSPAEPINTTRLSPRRAGRPAPDGPDGPGAPAPVPAPAPTAATAESERPAEVPTTGPEAPRGRQPRRAGPTGEAAGSSRDSLRQDGFAPFDIGGAELAEVPRPSLTTRDDGVNLVWNGVETGRTVLYRIVSREDVDVWSPDEGDLVAVTTETSVLDARPFSEPARFYSVWVNVGADDTSARAEQPRLLTQGVAIARATDLRLTEDHGSVIASWQVPQGVGRVDVVRVPAELAARRRGYQQEFLLARAMGRQSYRDTTCQPGAHYEYRLFAVRTDPVTGEESWSDATALPWRVSTMLTPVEELQVEERTDDARTYLDLSWTHPPLNDVVVYRTPTQPLVGLASDDLDVSALPGAGLADQHRLMVHPDIVDGRGQLTGIAWPAGWSRVHFTAVSVSGTTARIGVTATRSRTSAIESIRVVQRLMWQLLTFSWPTGAVSVSVLRTPPGTTMEDYPSEPVAVLSEADYRRQGGLRLMLPPEGCALHLVPMSFFQGKKIPGKPTTTAYPGLYRMAYRLAIPDAPVPTGRFGGRNTPPPSPPTRRRVEVIGQASRPPDVAVTLTLVMRRDRLPLSVLDAEHVLGSKRIPLPGGHAEDAWTLVDELDVEPFAGCYLRLFAQAEGLELAMLDPELGTLRP